jgi:hypothetical protein
MFFSDVDFFSGNAGHRLSIVFAVAHTHLELASFLKLILAQEQWEEREKESKRQREKKK